GRLAMDYGIGVVARIRIDIETAGAHHTFEGDIPFAAFPRDLRVAGSTLFDSFLLGGAEPRPAIVTDSTDPVHLLRADLAGFVPIPGLSGGFGVSAEAVLTAWYRTDRIEFSDALRAISIESDFTSIAPDAGEIGW